ncbi:MAG: TolC family outer membrane protein [Proteobacteria bacterium]|nr:TolC family outer membrane protein [Pseudomonadota bacterium]
MSVIRPLIRLLPGTSLSRLTGALSLALAAAPAGAIDLMQAYERALSQDASYQAARADADARREAVPQALAQLMPNVSSNLSRSKNITEQRSPNVLGVLGKTNYEYFSSNYGISLRQPLFRKYNFALYRQAKSDVETAEASLDKSLQDLVVRMAGSYFDALMAKSQYALVMAQKDAYGLQLAAAKQSFAKGQGTVIDVDDAQARYDMTVAQELEALQNLSYTRRALQVIVNEPVEAVADLVPARMELTPPFPDNVEEWIARAEETNPELRALRASMESANQELAKARSGHYPTADLFVQRSMSESDNNVSINSRYLTSQAGVQVSIPLFSGGYVSSQMRQARANIQKIEQQYEGRRREINLQVRKEYQNITEGIAKIQALQQAERSAERALDSNQKGLPAGTRSRVDILNAQQQLINTKRDLVQARLTYILARVRLQGLVSSLNEKEIQTINNWLETPRS